jgi:hypothetical protein
VKEIVIIQERLKSISVSKEKTFWGHILK